MKTCLDCKELKAKIPLVKVRLKTRFKTLSDFGIDYGRAGVSCDAGMFTLENKDGSLKDKVFKNVLRSNKLPALKSFNQAERCPFFASMNDDE